MVNHKLTELACNFIIITKSFPNYLAYLLCHLLGVKSADTVNFHCYSRGTVTFCRVPSYEASSVFPCQEEPYSTYH